MARKKIPVSVRFEVFKRDLFTCQYCGEKAPDVVLEVDHITPVSDGGSDDILNLVSACRSCNSGKSDKKLSDTSAVGKARRQAEDIEERRQQLEMIAKWHLSLMKVNDEAVDQLERLWFESTKRPRGFHLKEQFRDELRKNWKTFGYESVCAAIVSAASRLDDPNDGEAEYAAFKLIGKLCSVQREEESDPGVSRLYYLRGILRNKSSYINQRMVMEFLRDARDAGINVERMIKFAKGCYSWAQFRNTIQEELDSIREEREGGATDGTDA